LDARRPGKDAWPVSETPATDRRAAVGRSAEIETSARAACRRLEADLQIANRRHAQALSRERQLMASRRRQYAAYVLGDATTVGAMEAQRVGRLRVIDLTKDLGGCRAEVARLAGEISALEQRLEDANTRLERAVRAAARVRRSARVSEVAAGVAAAAGE